MAKYTYALENARFSAIITRKCTFYNSKLIYDVLHSHMQQLAEQCVWTKHFQTKNIADWTARNSDVGKLSKNETWTKKLEYAQQATHHSIILPPRYKGMVQPLTR